MTEATRNKSGHINALDGLRAIAVLIVMASHGSLGYIAPGQFGVTIFFFLSGYLITTLLRRELERVNDVNLISFYIRRVVRIFPPMYIAIVFTVILALFGLQKTPIIYANLVWDFLFLTNYAPLISGQSGIRIPLWSLDVEEHFYLLFPIIFLMLAKVRSNVSLVRILMAICFAVLAIRVGTSLFSDSYGGMYYWTHTRIDSILFGCCLAVWNNPVFDDKDHFANKYLSVLLASILILSSFLIRDPYFREVFRYTLQGLGLFLVFNFLIRDASWISRILEARIMKIIGLLSYTLYLVHRPIYDAIDLSMSGWSDLNRMIIGTCLSFAFAVVVYICVEKPLGRWRRDFEHRRKQRKGVAMT